MISITISCFANFSVQVKEHLEIFANIKGVSEDKIDSVVTEMVDEVSYPYSLLGDLTFLWFNLCSTHSCLVLRGAKFFFKLWHSQNTSLISVTVPKSRECCSLYLIHLYTSVEPKKES